MKANVKYHPGTSYPVPKRLLKVEGSRNWWGKEHTSCRGEDRVQICHVRPRMLVDTARVGVSAHDASALARRNGVMNQRSSHFVREVQSFV